jgi:hypothetical protein
MVGYSAILPHSSRPEATIALARSLQSVLRPLGAPVEILIVAIPAARRDCAALLHEFDNSDNVQVLRLVAGDGLDAAVFAAVAACRLDTILALDPAAGFSALDVPRLLERLVRHDMVVGRRRVAGWSQLVERTRRTLVPLPTPWHNHGPIFWAAHREALPVSLPLGAMQRLPVIVGRRGFRVDEVYVTAARGSARGPRTPTCARDLFAAWWLAGREHRAHCEAIHDLSDRQLRIDRAHTHHVSGITSHLGARTPSVENS